MNKKQYEQRRLNRIERLKWKAEKAKEKAEEHLKTSDSLVADIPFGQPILVGHHSEGAHRRRLERSQNHMFKYCEESNRAKDLERAAKAAEKNQSIFDDDPDAIEKLIRKLFSLQKNQDWMKEANKKLKKAKIRKDDPEVYTKILSLGFSKEEMEVILQVNRFYYGDGFIIPAFRLTNNNAEINRIKKRLAYLESKQAQQKTGNKEHIHGDIKIVENVEYNRLQVFFPDKPDEQTRTALKSHGFKWAKFYGCWQRQLNNNAKWGLKHALSIDLA